MLFIGILAICVGLLLMPIPLPLSEPAIAIGLILLLKHSHYAKKRYIKLRIFARHHIQGLASFLITLEKIWRRKKPRKNRAG